MMKYKNFLVVGGAGFVGSHVVESLVDHGANKVVVVDNMFLGKVENLDNVKKDNVIIYHEDARFLTAIENIIETEKPEVVYNLAVKCLPYGFIDPEGSFMVSVEITHNLVNLLRKGSYTKLLQFSSSEAYGSAEQIPMNESHSLNPTTPYGAGKAAADLLLLSYHKLFNLDINIIRPFNIYGERQNMEAYAAVVPVTIWRILNDQYPYIAGDGLQTRDFTYVKDVAEAAVNIMDYDEAIGKVINLGQGKEMNIKTVIRTICKSLDFPFEKVTHIQSRPSDVQRLCADITLATKIFGYIPKIDFIEGLDKTIEWFRGIKT